METSEGDDKYNEGEPFQDLNSNGKWDKSDELYVDLGNMSYDSGEVIGTATNHDRKLRKSFEPLEGEYVKVNDKVPYYEIQYVVYGFNYYGLKIPSNIYSIRASSEDGLIYVPMQKDAIVTIVPEGVETENPLTFSVAKFEKDYEEVIEDGYLIEHEFDYEGDLPTYKNPLAKSKSSKSFIFWFICIALVLVIFFILKNRNKSKITLKKIEKLLNK